MKKFKEVKMMITKIPPIESVNYGRDVGYDLIEISIEK